MVKKNLFGFGQKVLGSKVGRPLIYCVSKGSSGRVRAHLCKMVLFDDGSLSKILFRVGSIFCCSGRVSHLCFGFVFEKFPIKITNFQFFPYESKKSFLVKKYLGQVGSGPISSAVKRGKKITVSDRSKAFLRAKPT